MIDDETIIKAYLSGLSILDTARETGASKWMVEKTLKAAGVMRGLSEQYATGASASGKLIGRPAKELPEGTLEEMLRLYDGGKSAKAIAKVIGIDHHRATDIIREAKGLTSLKKGGYGCGGLKPGAIKRKAVGGDLRQCADCKVEKPLGEFRKNGTRVGGLAIYCKPCFSERSKWVGMKALYGVSREQFEDMLRKQEGVCAICHKPCNSKRRLSIDHCHATGRIRGLLCINCNHGLGHFKDSVELLTNARDYLSV